MPIGCSAARVARALSIQAQGHGRAAARVARCDAVSVGSVSGTGATPSLPAMRVCRHGT